MAQIKKENRRGKKVDEKTRIAVMKGFSEGRTYEQLSKNHGISPRTAFSICQSVDKEIANKRIRNRTPKEIIMIQLPSDQKIIKLPVRDESGTVKQLNQETLNLLLYKVRRELAILSQDANAKPTISIKDLIEIYNATMPYVAAKIDPKTNPVETPKKSFHGLTLIPKQLGEN